MKKLSILILAFILGACGHKKDNQQVSDKIFYPPPVVKGDADAKSDDSEPPTEKQLMFAEPGRKSGDGYFKLKADDPVPASKPASAIPGVDTSKKIIKQGDISFETTDITATRNRILQTLHKLGGYLLEDNQSLNTEENRREYTLKTRVPAKNFDVFLDSVASGAKQIDSKNISVEDVTTRYIDMATRLNNKKLLEARYLQLLKQASKMSDILEVETKLNSIRTEIESVTGELNYLNRQIAYSSLDITFYSKAKPVERHDAGIGGQFKKALGRGWAWCRRVFFDIIACWPVAVMVLIGLIYYKRKQRVRQDGV